MWYSLYEHFWLVMIVAASLFYFFGLPILILFTFRHEATPTLQTIEDREEIPGVARAHFVWAANELSVLGFDEVESLLLPQQMNNTMIYLRVFANRSEKDAAIVASYFVRAAGEWRLNVQNLEFCTRYQDGSEVNTNDNEVAGAFPDFPGVTNTNAPWLTASAALYRAHRRICRWVATNRTKTLRLDEVYDGDASEYIAAIIVEELEAARAVGYLRLVKAEANPSELDEQNPYQSPTSSSSSDRYVATIKGAYLMTWRQLWPIKPLWMRHRIRQGKRRLADAGFLSGSNDVR